MSLFGQRPVGSHERTAEEREQARREREARRRARAGASDPPADYGAAEERLREGRRAGVVDAPQRRIRVEDPPPEPWDEQPEIEGPPSTSETREVFEPDPLGAELFVYETEGRAAEPDSFLFEPESRDDEPEPFSLDSELRDDEPEPFSFESELRDDEPEPFSFESELRDDEPEPFSFESELRDDEPEPFSLESELRDDEPGSFAPEPQPGEVEPDPFAFGSEPPSGEADPFEFEPQPPSVEREPAGPPLEPPGRNGSSRAVEAESFVVEPEPGPTPSRADPDDPSPGAEGAGATAPKPGEDASAPVAPPLPPRLKRFRQERMEAAGKPTRRRPKRRATAGRPARGHPKPKATPPPRSPREAAKAVEERDKPGVRTWIARVLVPLVLVALLFVGWFMVKLYQPFTGEGKERVSVKVPNGLSARDIGDLLADRGVVDSGFFFALRSRMEGNRDELKAGTFAFRRDMSYVDAMAILVKGPPPIKTVTLTLPEGNTVRDYAGAVDDSKKVKGSYMRAVARARFNPARYGAPRPARYGAPRRAPLEGFLFPATYEYRTGRGTASDLVSDQLQAFKRTIRGISMRPARRAGLTPYEVLIVASMVERETSVPRERKIIAGVIYNRLRQGIPLGIDATIRYATNNWKRPIRQSELDEPGPYNTRQNQGLPPTPIGNPGLASIKAAASPKRTNFLFFVVKPGGDGEHAFSRTDAEFQRDVSRYNTARDARGGRDPR